MSTWKKIAIKVITKALETPEVVKIEDIDEKFAYISRHFYPFGERSHWPYKIWRETIKEMKNIYRKGGFKKTEKLWR